jgi:hypothetical protein
VTATSAIHSDWVVLIAAAALIFNAAKGWATGNAILFYRTVTRSEDPTLYWFAVIGSAILGIAAVLAVAL